MCIDGGRLGTILSLARWWQVASLKTGLSSEIPEFLQSWLFFALLSEFLHKEIDPHDFTYENSKIISTESLPKLLLEWKDMVDKESPDQKADRACSIDKALNDASRFVSTSYGKITRGK